MGIHYNSDQFTYILRHSPFSIILIPQGVEVAFLAYLKVEVEELFALIQSYQSRIQEVPEVSAVAQQIQISASFRYNCCSYHQYSGVFLHIHDVHLVHKMTFLLHSFRDYTEHPGDSRFETKPHSDFLLRNIVCFLYYMVFGRFSRRYPFHYIHCWIREVCHHAILIRYHHIWIHQNP